MEKGEWAKARSRRKHVNYTSSTRDIGKIKNLDKKVDVTLFCSGFQPFAYPSDFRWSSSDRSSGHIYTTDHSTCAAVVEAPLGIRRLIRSQCQNRSPRHRLAEP